MLRFMAGNYGIFIASSWSRKPILGVDFALSLAEGCKQSREGFCFEVTDPGVEETEHIIQRNKRQIMKEEMDPEIPLNFQ